MFGFRISRSELKKAIKFSTTSLQFTSLPIIYLNRGSAYGESGKISNALEDFARAEKLLSGDQLLPSVFYNRSLAHMENGDFDSALEDIEKGISLAPKYFSLFRNRGTVYSQNGEYDEAINDFNFVLNNTLILSEKAFTHITRGNTYKTMGEYEKALRDYNQAIKLMPDNPQKLRLRECVKRSI